MYKCGIIASEHTTSRGEIIVFVAIFTHNVRNRVKGCLPT